MKKDGALESIHDCVVAAWYRILGWFRHHVQSYIVDAKSPNTLVDIGNRFLMRFWGKRDAKSPMRSGIVLYETEVEEFVDGLLHNRRFVQPIMGFTHCDGFEVTRIDDHLIPLYWDGYSVFSEDIPMLTHKSVYPVSEADG
jgi:hypothetical protein